MNKHLAVFSPKLADSLLSGDKRLDCRLSKVKIPPYGVVSVGDIVYIKPSGKQIIGKFNVEQVVYVDTPGEREWRWLYEELFDELAVDKKFLQDRRDSRYMTLIRIGPVASFFTPPARIVKHDRRPWVVL